MLNTIIIGLIILAYAIPFIYILVADIADIIKRTIPFITILGGRP